MEYQGPKISLKFDYNGDKKTVSLNQYCTIKDAINEYLKKCGLTENDVKKYTFFFNGNDLSTKMNELLKDNFVVNSFANITVILKKELL